MKFIYKTIHISLLFIITSFSYADYAILDNQTDDVIIVGGRPIHQMQAIDHSLKTVIIKPHSKSHLGHGYKMNEIQVVELSLTKPIQELACAQIGNRKLQQRVIITRKGNTYQLTLK